MSVDRKKNKKKKRGKSSDSDKSIKSSKKSSNEGSVDKRSLLKHGEDNEEHEKGCSQKFKLCLRVISLGKYKTPLYF